MERITANDFHPEVLKLFDKYVHGLIDRRGFLDGAGKVVGAAGAATALDLLRPNYSEAQIQIQPDDKRVKSEWIEYQSPDGYGKVRALLARPANAKGRLPAIMVVHENRGLNPHIQDVVRRTALAGYVALGPDMLGQFGGWPGTDEEGVKLQSKLEQPKMMADFESGLRFLKTHAESSGRLGVTGFCFGGGVANQMAVRLGADLAAAAPFYGGQPRAEDVPKIKAAMQMHYAADDERINAGIAAYEAALKANKVRYEIFTYPGTQHGFHNDTTPRFSPDAAKLAWQRTLDHFNKYVKTAQTSA
jgi:carboxymethylenebutenolidase